MTAPRPLIVRLRNWVGDVVLSVPTLQRLHDAGFALQLLGKAWAADLLAGHGWPVTAYPAKLPARVQLLRHLRHQAQVQDAMFDHRINTLAFPFSFSCALEMRLAGLRALGHAHEARGWLLSKSLPKPGAGPERPHELAVYWSLGDALLGKQATVPQHIELRSSQQHRQAARELLAAHGIRPGFIVICPFAGGTFEGLDKTWASFAEFAQGPLRALQRDVLLLPGPGEEAQAHREFAGCTVLDGVRLGTYAALLREARLMVSNDTGPGHLAAAVGTTLVSVLGPTDPRQWGAWGPDVHIVQGGSPQQRSWPDVDTVMQRVQAVLEH